jgi:hypothetical protein
MWVDKGRAFLGNVHLPYVDPKLAPAKLWRGVNAGGNDLRVRGNKVGQGWGVPINTANFQLRIERHFNWKHPDESPVMSCTAEKGFAENICRKWVKHGTRRREEVALLEIDFSALLGDPMAKVWKQEDIVNASGLHGVQVYQHEYIVLAGIPTDCCKQIAWE